MISALMIFSMILSSTMAINDNLEFDKIMNMGPDNEPLSDQFFTQSGKLLISNLKKCL